MRAVLATAGLLTLAPATAGGGRDTDDDGIRDGDEDADRGGIDNEDEDDEDDV